jgi:hypothetical protein
MLAIFQRQIRIRPLLLSLVILFGAAYPYAARSEPRKQSSFPEFSRLFPTVAANKIPDVAHFNAGRSGFSLDRTKRKQILFKFDSDDEVWVLKSVSGPRGDEFLRNDVGQVVLRINSLGGITIFNNSDSGGVAAELTGKAKGISPQNQIFSGSLQSAVDRSAGRFTGKYLQTIHIEVTGGLQSYLVYDALERVADGLSQIPPKYFNNKKYKIKKVRLNRAPNPFVILQDGTLEVGLTPGIGYSGRPSSAAVKLSILGAN